MSQTEPVEVFISYAQEDESLCDELEKHLKTLQREKAISSWHDRKIVAGTEFTDEIDYYLNRAGIILLLMSPDFIASDYHWTVELTRALERHAAGKARIIPILLRHADWETPPIDKFLPLPKNRHPVKSAYWSDRDAAFLEIVKEIRKEVKRLIESPRYSSPNQNTLTQEILSLNPAPEEPQSQTGNITSDDITLALTLSLGELTYGVEKRVALQDGEVKVTIPPGLSPGKKLRLRNKGKLNPQTHQKGDLYLKIFVDAQVDISTEDYQRRLRQYEQELIKVTRLEFPLSEYSLEGLRNYQRMLELRDKDVCLVKDRVNIQEVANRIKRATVLINEANKLSKKGNFEDAISKYLNALKYNSSNAFIYNNLGFTLGQQGKLNEAVDAYRRAIQIDPNDATAYNNLGSILDQQGKLEEAVDAHRKATQVDPNNATTYLHLGFILGQQGKLEEAVDAYRKAIQIEPNVATAYYNIGFILGQQGKLEEAVDACRKAIQIDPNDATAYKNLGSILHQQGKLEEAVDACRKAIQVDPNNATTYHHLGFILDKQGKLNEAVKAYRKAIQIDFNDATAYNNLGFILGQQGKLNEAVDAYRRAIQIDPNIAIVVYRNLGLTLSTQGKLDEAVDAYRKAIQIDPNDATAYHHLGFTLVEQGKLDEAVDAHRKAIQIDPNNAAAYYNLGSTLDKQGKLDEAVDAYRKAIQIDPHFATAYNNLGFTLDKQGKLNEAVKAYRKAIQIDPSNKLFNENLNSILKSKS